MDWGWKELVQIACFALLVGTALALALLRLGDLTSWPGRGVALAVLAVILAPVVIGLLAAARDSAAGSDGSDGLLSLLLPPWF
jgi:hypothetical protein